jgi:hypothetical protein
MAWGNLNRNNADWDNLCRGIRGNPAKSTKIPIKIPIKDKFPNVSWFDLDGACPAMGESGVIIR